MKSITEAQIKAIRTLTRRANRRLERATPGQLNYLEQYVKRMTGGSKFSGATKGLSYYEAAAKLKSLESFLSHEGTTTRRGWEIIKKKSIPKTRKTLKGEGYNLTDQELAELLEQADIETRTEFYRAINLVQAAKDRGKKSWEGSAEQIAEVLSRAAAEKVEAQEALEAALLLRPKLRGNALK